MSADAMAGTVIAGFAVLWGMTVVILSVLVRGTARWTKAESRIDQLGRDMLQIRDEHARAYSELLVSIREYRRHTNDRLIYLERSQRRARQGDR